MSGSSFPVPSYSLRVGSGNENRSGTPHVINFQRFSEGGEAARGGGEACWKGGDKREECTK